MLVQVYSIYDNKSLSFGQPFSFSHTGQAVRAFSDLANDPSTMMYRHPADFSLVRIGTFDMNTGVMFPEPHQSLGPATQFRQANQVSMIGPELPFDDAGLDHGARRETVQGEG